MKRFPPFRLDTLNQCLWRDGNDAQRQRVLLTPKAYAVLTYLVDHAGRLVARDELLDAVWPRAAVQPEVLKSQIRDLRRVLGDHPKIPRFVETVSRRGYRFIATVTDERPTAVAEGVTASSVRLFGRDRALDELADCLRRTVEGSLQIAFVTGEPGIGKSALVEEFISRAASQKIKMRIARGQCVEGYGGKEAYFPVLEALGQLCAAPSGASVVQILAACAPTWLIQFPAHVRREHRLMLQREILGATRDRMLREIGDALGQLTATVPLLLVLEDLQWVDHSSVDLISALARSRGKSRLMVIGTFRPLELALTNHPLKELKRELLAHALCREIALDALTEADVAEYLSFPSASSQPPKELAHLIHRHSGGNPLFMTAALDHMSKRGLLSRASGQWNALVPLEEIELEVPDNLRRLIEAQIERISMEEQQALGVASVAGVTFTTAVGDAVSNLGEDGLEALCDRLSRQNQLVRSDGYIEMSDGSVVSRYQFVHALYREVFYRQLPLGHRTRLHRRIGEILEQRFSQQLSELTPVLAHHFEAGADWTRAIRYLSLQAEGAGRRWAPGEATMILERARAVANNLPHTDRAEREIEILEQLASIYLSNADPRALEAFEALSARASEYSQVDVQIRSLTNLAWCRTWTSIPGCIEAAERALALCARQPDPITRAGVRLRCHFFRILACGWNADDAAECSSAYEELRRSANPGGLELVLIDYAYFQMLSSEFEWAAQLATEGAAILRQRPTANAYMSPTYHASTFIVPWALFLSGDWGEALGEIDAGVTMMDRNGDHFRAHRMRLFRAWVHLHAMDFTNVLTIVEAAHSFVQGPTRFTMGRIAQILAGLAETGLGRVEGAREHLLAAKADMDRQAVPMDWYWRLPLELGIGELWLANGELLAARRQSQQLLQLSLCTSQHMWRALALDLQARVAVADHDDGSAQQSCSTAICALSTSEIPLAAWRVHATASELFERQGDSDSAQQHRNLSRLTIRKLAQSLSPVDPLQKAFLSSPRICQILGDDPLR